MRGRSRPFDPRVAFLSWSIVGPIGFLHVMIVTKLKPERGLPLATLTHARLPSLTILSTTSILTCRPEKFFL